MRQCNRCRGGSAVTLGPSEIQIFSRERHVGLCPGPPRGRLELPPLLGILLGTVQLLQELSRGNAFTGLLRGVPVIRRV